MAKHPGLDKAFVEQFAVRLRFLRKVGHLTQAQLAEKAGISVEHLSKLERGCSSPSFSVICSLAQGLETEPANLFLFALPCPKKNPQTGEVTPPRHFFQSSHLPGPAEKGGERGLPEGPTGMPGPHCEYSFVHKDGEIWRALMDWDVEPGERGKPGRVSGFILDITELKQLEGYLVSSCFKLEERVRERIECLIDVIRKLGEEVRWSKRIEKDLRSTKQELTCTLSGVSGYVFLFKKTDHCIAWANKMAEELFGNGKNSLAGKKCWQIWGKEKRHCSICPVKAAFERRKPHRVKKTLPDGTILSLRAFPCFHDNRELFGVVLMGEDVTGDKQEG